MQREQFTVACKICVLKVKKKVVAVEREVAGGCLCVESGADQFVFFHFIKACKLYIQYILYVLFMYMFIF